MAIQDLWVSRDGVRTKRYGRGLRYRVRVDGYKATSHRTRKEAEFVNAQRLAAGPPKPSDGVTVGELLDRWLEAKRGLSEAGFTACQGAAAHARIKWGSVPADKITRPRVAEWIAGLQVVDKRTGVLRGASVSLKAKAIQALGGALQIAVDEGGLDRNPARGVYVGTQARRAVTVLSADEVKALAEATGDQGYIVMLLATTGLRIGEARALNVGDVDVKRRRMAVRKSKTGRAREVPIAASVLALLDLDRPRDAPLLTAKRGGGRLNIRSFRRWVLDPATERIGRPDITPHVLRHTAASLAIAAGADVKAVQRMLGHTSAKMTLDVYGHLFDARLDDVAERMGVLLG